jgi:hypothetical protein
MSQNTAQSPSQAVRIIRKFGGIRATARALSSDPAKRMPVSTVQGWKQRGYVPFPYWERVVDAADATGVALEPTDFIGHLIERLETRNASR